MKYVAALSAPLLLVLAGCLSAPIPEELVDIDSISAPVSAKDIVRLSGAGISDEAIVGLIRTRCVADRPSVERLAMLRREGVSEQVELALLAVPAEAPPGKPARRLVYRELFIPLWPSYSRGRWHVGLRIGCYYGATEEKVQEFLPGGSGTSEPPPPLIDP